MTWDALELPWSLVHIMLNKNFIQSQWIIKTKIKRRVGEWQTKGRSKISWGEKDIHRERAKLKNKETDPNFFSVQNLCPYGVKARKQTLYAGIARKNSQNIYICIHITEKV